MTRNHPTGQILQKQHKPGDGFTGLSLSENLLLTGAVIEEAVHIKRPKCPRCGREFTAWEFNKARSTGIIKCVRCCTVSDLKELLKDGTSATGH
jgi:hypothetical protein